MSKRVFTAFHALPTMLYRPAPCKVSRRGPFEAGVKMMFFQRFTAILEKLAALGKISAPQRPWSAARVRVSLNVTVHLEAHVPATPHANKVFS